MSLTRHAIQYGQRRLLRKMLRAVPYLGGVVAVVTIGAAMRRKGVVNGAVDTALDMIPFVGAAKNVAEVVRGRDFFADVGSQRRSITRVRHEHS
jgi:hypothetical protein